MHQINNKEPENIFAKDVKGQIVFILESESGARGYYCLGCNNEMEAVRRRIVGYRSYFRHHYKGTPPENKCTYSDETYRHALAKSIFQETRQIKVPQLLKYHPTDKNALAIKLKDAEILEATRVAVELPFFENEDGEVCWSKTASFRNENLLIQPDITFFDTNDKPFLLIEIVATHKIDDAKKAKIRLLGINTVQITIPKDSPEAIAECLKSAKNTKWVYHNEEAKSDYLQLSQLNPETISHFDAEQRKLLGETFTCREAEINNLIRSIDLCLQSEQYGRVREKLSAEISKVERFTGQQDDELREIEEEHRKEHEPEFRRQAEELDLLIEAERAALERHITKQADLESRYHKKRTDIEGKNRQFEQQIFNIGRGDERATRVVEAETTAIENEILSIERSTRNAGREIQLEENEILRIGGTIEQILGFIESSKPEFERRTSEMAEDFGSRIREAKEITATFENSRGTLPENFQRKKEELDRQLATEEEEFTRSIQSDEDSLRKRISELRETAFRQITTRTIEGNSELSLGIKRIISQWESIRIISEKKHLPERLRRSIQSISNGSYKNILERFNGEIH